MSLDHMIEMSQDPGFLVLSHLVPLRIFIYFFFCYLNQNASLRQAFCLQGRGCIGRIR